MPIYATPKRVRKNKNPQEMYTPVDVATLGSEDSYSKYSFYLLLLILILNISIIGWWWIYKR